MEGLQLGAWSRPYRPSTGTKVAHFGTGHDGDGDGDGDHRQRDSQLKVGRKEPGRSGECSSAGTVVSHASGWSSVPWSLECLGSGRELGIGKRVRKTLHHGDQTVSKPVTSKPPGHEKPYRLHQSRQDRPRKVCGLRSSR